MTKWQLHEAKKRLSEVVRKALDEGPQVIALRGDDAAVVVAADEYARLSRKTKGTLVDFLRKSPLRGVTLDHLRSHDTGRQHVLTAFAGNTDGQENYGARCFNPRAGK